MLALHATPYVAQSHLGDITQSACNHSQVARYEGANGNTEA